MAQWIALAAHGQWAMGSYPIRAIGVVRKGIRPKLLLRSRDNPVPKPTQKKAHFRVSHKAWRLLTDVRISYVALWVITATLLLLSFWVIYTQVKLHSLIGIQYKHE